MEVGIMRKFIIPVVMILFMTVVAHLALTDETVPFPYWKHGDGIFTFFSIVNAHETESAIITISFQEPDGSLFLSKSAQIGAGGAWLPASYESWWVVGPGSGYGSIRMETGGQGPEYDTIYIWGAVFGSLADSSPGFSLLLTGNPYGGLLEPPTPGGTPTFPPIPATGPMGMGLILAVFTVLMGMGSLRRRY